MQFSFIVHPTNSVGKLQYVGFDQYVFSRFDVFSSEVSLELYVKSVFCHAIDEFFKSTWIVKTAIHTISLTIGVVTSEHLLFFYV